MREASAPLLFDDEELDGDRTRRNPVAPAQVSVSAKKVQRRTPDGFEVHSFRTLLQVLGAGCRNLCQIPSDPNGVTFHQLTELTPTQARAFQLLGL